MTAASPIVDWRAIARAKFPGFSVTGNGCFCVPSTGTVLIVELFDHPLLANDRASHLGAKVLQLQPPAPRAAFRMIHIRD
jgi:hypothetical protein